MIIIILTNQVKLVKEVKRLDRRMLELQMTRKALLKKLKIIERELHQMDNQTTPCYTKLG